MTLGITSRRRAKSRWLAVGVIVVMASALVAAGSITLASSTGQAATINQCANGPTSAKVICTQANKAWVNGNLNAQDSHYREGDSVPFQVLLTGMNAGTHDLIVNWAETAGSKHAYDYLDTYTQSETTADACTGVSGMSGLCGSSTTTTTPILADPRLTAATCPFEVNGATQIPGVITFYNATGISFAYSAGNPSTCTGTANTGFADISFSTTASQTSAVIAWGGHIASSLDWGAGQSASAISGSPYHMAQGTLDGASTGSQDRSIKASAILPEPTIVTVADSAAGTVPTVTSGGSFTDVATLTGTTANGSVTGTVDFYMCGPTTGVAACTSGGTAEGTGTALTTLATSPPSSTATSASASPTATGFYCFRVVYHPDLAANYSPGQSTSTTNECVQVVTLNTSTTSTPQTGATSTGTFADATSATIGAYIRDKAVVSDTSTPTGKVDFSVCGPTTTAAACTSGGTAEGTDVVAASTTTSSATFYSTAFQPSTVGWYCFRANFKGSGAFQNSSDPAATSTSTSECIDILPATPGATTSPSATTSWSATLQDSATISGGDAPTGTITFKLFAPSDASCLGTPVATEGITVTGNGSYSTVTGYTTTSVSGTYHWIASYDGDTNNSGFDTTCGEAETITPASSNP